MSINIIKYNKINKIVLKLDTLANSYYGKDLGNSPYTVDRYVSMMKKSADLLVP